MSLSKRVRPYYHYTYINSYSHYINKEKPNLYFRLLSVRLFGVLSVQIYTYSAFLAFVMLLVNPKDTVQKKMSDTREHT